VLKSINDRFGFSNPFRRTRFEGDGVKCATGCAKRSKAAIGRSGNLPRNLLIE
jgi:hypothetical protein